MNKHCVVYVCVCSVKGMRCVCELQGASSCKSNSKEHIKKCKSVRITVSKIL